ncbi:10143_t:CDS:2 [Racocetra fulgida]|uniref:10143_t:CDS:1 n=1 Tax=Racocetra fulgida TaxID=60492 RepID=A0A9N9A932_9GLOM|nr:10143_t:CDS:2 [Racocetra fulgida]
MIQRFPILYITGDDDKYLHVDKHKEAFDELVADAPENAVTEYYVIERDFRISDQFSQKAWCLF